MKKDQKESPEKKNIHEHKTNPYLRMRSRRDQKDPNYKTTVLYDPAVLPKEGDQKSFAARLATKLSDVPGHRPISKFGQTPPKTPRKRPWSVSSPGGTKYTREKDLGCVLIYSNRHELETPRVNLEKIDPYVKELLKDAPASGFKSREIVITAELLDAMDADRAAGNIRGRKKIPDQNTTMARESKRRKEASATKIAALLGLQGETNLAREWLHLIAFMFEGRMSQDALNLSGGTAYANTDMIFAEDELVYLAYILKEEISLSVQSKEMGTHFSEEILIKMTSKNFELTFVIDPQTSIKPSYRNKDYVHALTESIVEVAQEFLSKPEESKLPKLVFEPADPPEMPMLFFKSAEEFPPSAKRRRIMDEKNTEEKKSTKNLTLK